jgi:uncharacterized delta-60 repeat protein
VAIQSDGKIVAAGIAVTGTNHDFGVVRYNANGTLDTSFNGTGKVTTAIGSSTDDGRAVAIQLDGKIVVAGNSFGTNDDIALVRYNTNGSLDTTFNGTGKVITAIGTSTDVAQAVVIQSDGKIVAGGYSQNVNRLNFAVVRYNTNGSLDTTFNGTGKVTTGVGLGSSVISGLTIQPDGKIIAVGNATLGSATDFAVARYNSNGSVDTTFNGTGQELTDFEGGYDGAVSVIVQTDGKILAAGYASIFNAGNDFGIVRYNTDGSLDASFNGTGKVNTPFGTGTNGGNNQDAGAGIAIQPNGKIIAGGYGDGGNYDFAIARYNTDGSLDSSFGEGGRIATDLGSTSDQPHAMALQPNGRIVLAGVSNNIFAVARYHADAHARSDFDGDFRADIAIWNPNNTNWYVLESRTNLYRSPQPWGTTALGDIAVPGDYDGDGQTDYAVWRPSDGNWYVLKSTGGGTAQGWGTSGDAPVPGDYDGDGKTDVAVFRPSEGNWYIINSSTNALTIRNWGASTDKMVPADYDGDGKTDVAVYRPSEGNWYIINSATSTLTIRNWGASTDKLVPADYDGDGKTDIAVFRPSEGNWYIINSGTSSLTIKNWGVITDLSVPADYDLDGKADIAVYRPTEGNWYIINSSTAALNLINLGDVADVPVPNAYLPQ